MGDSPTELERLRRRVGELAACEERYRMVIAEGVPVIQRIEGGTGYSEPPGLPDSLVGHLRVSKPLDAHALQTVLRTFESQESD